MILRLLSVLPRKWLSHLTGMVVHARRPAFFARWLKHLLIRRLGIDTVEAELPLASYPSFGDFFARRLKEGSRPLAAGDLLAPCDGRIVQSGTIENGRLLQCKGLDYGLEALLRRPELAAPFEGGHFITIYLAPHNYHRVHMPLDGHITSSLFIEGDLWPVNQASVARIPELFCVNERWVSLFDSSQGLMAMVMVGATNVGSIHLHHVARPPGAKLAQGEWFTSFHPALKSKKGDEYGIFNMGSTVILLFERSTVTRLSLAGLGFRQGPVRCGEDLLEVQK